MLTWLAFGTPVTKETFLGGPVADPFFRQWGTSNPEKLLTLLEARVGLNPFCPFTYGQHLHGKNGPRFLRGLRAKFRRAEGSLVTYAELAARLRARVDADVRQAWELADATADLLGALRDCRITAFATTGSGARQPVAVDTFMHPAITVTVFDQVTVDAGQPLAAWADYHGPTFEDVTFRTRDVAQSGLVPIPHRPKPDGRWLSAYEALCWIRFRDFPERAAPGGDFDEARGDLLARFRDGQVPAQGRPDTRQNTPNPDAGHDNLDPDKLTQDAITLTEWGRIGPDLSRQWENRGRVLRSYSDVRFDRATVVQLWPAHQSDPSLENALAWLKAHIDPTPGTKKPKRAVMIAGCREALHCSFETARAAFDKLPRGYKNPRGSPGSSNRK